MEETRVEKKTSLSEKTGDRIIQYIEKNHLEPGDRLPPESKLVEQFGVSRSTVREAVRRLVTRNILTVKQGSGMFVSGKRGVPEDPLGIELMQDNHKLAVDLLDIRLMLEPEIAALAAINATDNQLEKLKEAHELVGSAIINDLDHTEADISFHKLLAVMSGNAALANLIPIISSAVDVVIGNTNNALKSCTYEQHKRILDAIQRHDATGARTMMISHLSLNREYILNRLADESMAESRDGVGKGE